MRVAQLASRFPRVLDELRSGAIHLTGLFLLAPYLTTENADALLSDARRLSRQGIEQLIARWFPKADVESRIDPVATQPGLPLGEQGPQRSGRPASSIGPRTAGTEPHLSRSKVEPLSASRYRVQFTASEELCAKIEQAKELLSHVLSQHDLPALFERAIDALIEKEVRRRRGAGGKRKRRQQKAKSRHVPVEVVGEVWRRDSGQCTFVDAQGRRCSERRFVTIEHIQPFALGGPPTLENLSLLCASHNAHSARRVFGEAHIETKRRDRAGHGTSTERVVEVEVMDDEQARSREQTAGKVCSALSNMGFRKHEVSEAMAKLRGSAVASGPTPLLRAALALLVPANAPPH